MMTPKDAFNPFPGLRPFNFKDRKFFFGRDCQIREVVEKISDNKFVAIIGSSGSGKSSLINAGIIPCITEASNNRAGSSLRVVNLKPGLSPIDNLAKALVGNTSNIRFNDSEKSQPDKISSLLLNKPDGLSEALRKTAKDSQEEILLVIDQFEDLFRFYRSRNNLTNIHEYEILIRLIVEAQKQEHIPIHILLSIRSDFIEEFHQFQDLNTLISNSSYFLPEMTSEDMQEAVFRPAILTGNEIDPEFGEQLINDLRYKTDKLPLLQYLLNRTWGQWMSQTNNDRPVSPEDFEAVGGLDNSLIRHIDEAYEELGDAEKLICEGIFKTITEKGTDNREISIPMRISDIAFITRSGDTEIIDIVEKFRQPDRPFLVPSHEIEIDSDTIVELSHESLMRLWPRLRNWMREEAESVILYKRLAEASKSYQVGQGELLEKSVLQQAMLWLKKNEPSFEWAQRYNTAFEMTIQYIRKSKEHFDLSEEKNQKRSRRALMYTRAFAVILVLLVSFLVFLIINHPKLLSEVQPQFELVEQRGASVDEQTGIAEVTPDKLVDSSRIMRDQFTVSPSQQITDNNLKVEELFTEDEVSSDGEPVSRNIVIDESPATIAEKPSQQTSRLDQSENVAVEEDLGRRMVEASKSLALLSLKVEEDTDLKALLALQSHIFNERYMGGTYNPDILSGLIASINNLYGVDYNAYVGHTESVNSLVFRPASSIFYSASSDGRVIQWDVNDEARQPKVLIQNQTIYNTMAISQNSQWLAVGTDGMGVLVFNPASNIPNPIRVNWGNNRIVALDFYPDNEHILFAGSDNELVRFNFRRAQSDVIARLDSDVLSLSISPDGEMIVAGTRSGKVILIRDGNDSSGRILHSDEGNDVLAVSFNASGTRIASGSLRGEVRILEVSNGNLLATLRGHSARVVDLEFCPVNKFIASSSFDGTVHLWDAQNFSTRPLVFTGHGSWVRSVAFNSAGDKMVSGSRQESRLLSWPMDSNHMASVICEKVSRSLTIDEWNQYVGEDIPYRNSCQEFAGR